jgi:hypothetical protein
MITKKKRTDDELVRALHVARANDALEEMLAKSDDEIAREIDAAGGDAGAIGERGATRMRERLSRSERASGAVTAQPQHDTKVVPLRKPFAIWLAAAAVAALAITGGAVVAGLFHHEPPKAPEQPVPTIPEPPPENRVATAADLREKARASCAAEDWRACFVQLEAAKDRDPDGDRAPDIQKLRSTIRKHLTDKPPRP